MVVASGWKRALARLSDAGSCLPSATLGPLGVQENGHSAASSCQFQSGC